MKILVYDPRDYSDENLETLRDFKGYNRIKNAFRKFEISCNLSIFQKFYGKEEGSRLWNHFTVDCNRNLEKFFTYLKKEQLTSLHINMYKNDELYY